jgi:ATP-binding cassette subfamily B protein
MPNFQMIDERVRFGCIGIISANGYLKGSRMSGTSLLRRFAVYYRPHRGLFVLDFGSAVTAGLLELAFPVAVTLFIDRLLPTGQLALIALAAFGLLVIYVVNAALQMIVIYWGHMLGLKIETEMRSKAFDHLQKLSFSYFDNQKTGHLVARLTKDLEEIGEIAHHGPEDVFIAIMTLIGAFLLMFWVHPPLAILTALIVPVTAWVTTRYGRRMTLTWHSLYGRVADFNARIEETVGGIRVVQAFANEDHERRLFAVNNARYLATKLQAYWAMAASTSLSYLSMRFVQVVVMLAGAWYVTKGELSAGGFVGFLLLVGVFFRPIDKINSVIETYPKGIAGFQRYSAFLDTSADIADRPGAKVVPRLKGEISYDTETERAIQQSLAELSQGRTTLVIAHRLATITEADRICVIEGGKVVEQGSHSELLHKTGPYRRLHLAQQSRASA